MKKIITFIALVISYAGMSQGVTVSTTQSPTELINNVLISSPCFVATNVSASTGSNFGSTSGIGYFSNVNPNNPNLPNNPNFPFKSGVVLTTGDVNKVPSPNNAVLSDGIAAWPGDTEMKIALQSQGVNINPVNASYLQFEFIATTPTFSLSFIFASEEYGASQCNYSDAFAFLIKNVTDGGAYQNVATVPSPAIAGTPITVATIRNSLYNPNCSSVNPTFFGTYNGDGFGPAINFNGETIPMIASTQLIVGKTYRVKLVIADGNNNVGYDSAIFLEAKTLNIGGEVLGLDYVSSNEGVGRNGLCSPVPLTTPISWPLNSCPILKPEVTLPTGTGYTYKWSKILNGTLQSIASQTTQTLNFNNIPAAQYYWLPQVGSNTYALTYKSPGCIEITDYIVIQVFQPINALAVVPPLTKCNTGAPNYSFDLTKTANVITTNNTAATNDDLNGVTITFHTSIVDANNNVSVPTLYTVASAPAIAGVTLYAKIKNNTTGCSVIRSFDLKVVAPPTIVLSPLNLTLCGETPSPAPRASFDINNNINLILGTQDPTIYTFSFHTTASGANTSSTTDNLFMPTSYIKNTTSTTIYIRLQNILDPTCFVPTSFTVTVTPLAYVDILPDVIVCNNFVLPTLTQPGSQYWTETDGPTGTGVLKSAGDTITPGATPTTIWVYNENGICKTNDSFKITKANLTTITPLSKSVCQTDSYSLPGLPYGTYYMLAGGPSTPNQATPPNNLFSTPGPKTIYVWFENPTEIPVCGFDNSFTITIIPFTLLPDYTDKFSCTPYALTAAGNGGTYYSGPDKGLPIINPGNINATKTIWVYKESGTTPTNCTSEKSFTVSIGLASIPTPQNVDSCTPYMLPTLTFGIYAAQPNGGSPYAPNAMIGAIGQTTVYFYVPGQSCTANLSFTVNISLPALAPIPDEPSVCDVFYFPVVASHPNGKYYKQPNAQGPSFTPNDPLTGYITTLGLQTIYFYYQAPNGCYVQDDFQLTIYASSQISQRPISVVRCNQTFVLDDLDFGDYYKFPNGPSTTNPILLPTTIIAGNDIGFPYSEIWVYSGSSDPLNTCSKQYSIKIYFVNTTVNPIADITQCDSYMLPAIVGPGDYWNAPGGPLGGGTKILPPYNVPSKLITGTTTLYVYAEDNNRVACSDQDAFTVTIVRTPNLVAQTNPISICDSYTMPQYNDPMFTFTATNSGTVTKFYKNPGGAAANLLATDVYAPGQFIQNTNADFSPMVITFYPYAELLGAPAPCFENEKFVVNINRTPVIVAAEVVDVTACDTFSLLPLTIGKYFSAATHLAIEELPVGYTITDSTAPTTVYVYAETATTPNCFDPVVEDIVVTIVTTPVIGSIAPVSSCDTYVLPAFSDPMFSSTQPITKFYKNLGGPVNNPLTSDEYAEGQTITNNGTTPLIVTIYAYSVIGTVPCFDDEPFVVTIDKSPIIVPAEIVPITKCDTYTLPALTVGKYYSTMAHNPADELTGAQLTLTNPSTTVYVFAENPTNPNCTDSDSFVVTIVPTPVITSPIAAQFSCESYTIPAYSSVTSTPPITKFYKNAGGIANNSLVTDVYTPGQVINNTGNTPLVFNIYAYAQAGSVPCFKDEPFAVTINKSPVIVAAEVVPVTKCDSHLLLPLTVGNYFSDALHNNPITNFTLTTTQTVYVYAKNGTAPNICTASASFLVTINKTPKFTAAEVADVSKCDNYILPLLSIPGAKYYTGDNATGSEILAGTIFTSDTTVFAYAETGTVPNCPVSKSINIQIYNVVELQDVIACGEYKLLDLADPNAGYYQFSGGIGFIAAGTTLLNSQTVFVRGTSPTSTCTDESDFIVTINSEPLHFDASDSVCDNDSSPYDGITTYDLTTLIPTILGNSQAPTDFTVTFYVDFNRTVQIIDPTICTLPIVYVFVTNNLSPTCPSPATVTINVIPLPNPKLDVPPICIDSETGVVTNSVIESGYNSSQYNIVWTNAAGTVVSNNQAFSTDVPGDYILNVASNTVTTCASATVPFTVIESAKPAVTPPITFAITGWFTNSQTITVNATPYINNNGINFEYSLDGQTPQVSNIFTNVDLGAHEITVIDIYGCGSRSLPIPVQLVTSPPAFTPNGDGINDRWDIKGEISYTTLSIYDRFGRLLKQLTQNSGGWDGTINSQTLPADDYWFSVNYIDSSGAAREYKSHFSLIR